MTTAGNTNVKQGAVVGGWVCFGVGMLFMALSFWTIIIYGPLLFVAFILSIVAMSQGRIVNGVSLLLCCLIIPPIAMVGLAVARSEPFSTPGPSSVSSPTPALTATPSPAVAEIPRAVSLDATINIAKNSIAPDEPPAT